jgi:hypothetical protein
MAKIVYFDTNIFAQVSDKAKNTLIAAVDAGKISIPLSLINVEEVFCAIEGSDDVAKKKFTIISELSKNQKILKAPDNILSDDIRSFINFGVPTSPFYRASFWQINIKELTNLKRREEFQNIINKIKEEKINFKLENIKSRGEVLIKANKLDFVPTFSQYWDSLKYDFARGLIEEVGVLEKYKYKNINALLEFRSVKLCIGWMASYIYGQTFENRRPDRGDSRDMKHAVLASAADIFLTHDGDLADLMKRIPIENFEVCDLQDLLNKI